jgi:hypothetical protein
MELRVMLEPVGRIEQVDPSDRGTQQPRVGGATR